MAIVSKNGKSVVVDASGKEVQAQKPVQSATQQRIEANLKAEAAADAEARVQYNEVQYRPYTKQERAMQYNEARMWNPLNPSTEKVQTTTERIIENQRKAYQEDREASFVAPSKSTYEQKVAETQKQIDTLQREIDSINQGAARAKAYGMTSGEERVQSKYAQIRELQKKQAEDQMILDQLNGKAFDTAYAKKQAAYADAGVTVNPYTVNTEDLRALAGQKTENAGTAKAKQIFKSKAETYQDTAAKKAQADRALEGKEIRDKYSRVEFDSQFRANTVVGRLGIDINQAWNEYAENPTAANKQYALDLEQAVAKFSENNEETLTKDTWSSMITEDLALYLPQLRDQTLTSAVGAILGGSLGAVVGNPKMGAKVGVVAASGAYSYKVARGAAFRSLVELGVPEDVAREASKDEALLSAMVEMGDTLLDVLSFGKTAAGKGLAKALGKEALEFPLEKLGKALAKWAGEKTGRKVVADILQFFGRIGSEALEEGTQGSVSIANRERALSGAMKYLQNGEESDAPWYLQFFNLDRTIQRLSSAGELLGYTAGTVSETAKDVVDGGGTSDNTKEILEQMHSGGVIAFLTGGADPVVKIVGAAKNVITTQEQMAEIGAQVRNNYGDNAVIAAALENAPEGSAVRKLAEQLRDKKLAGEEISDKDIGRLLTLAQEDAPKTKTEKQQAEVLEKLTENEDPAVQQYAEVQQASPDVKVVSPYAQELMDSGMKPEQAVVQAALIEKVVAGKTLTRKEQTQVQLGRESVRQVFVKATGVEVTDAQSRNGSERRQIFKSAYEIAQAKQEAKNATENATVAETATEATTQFAEESAPADNGAAVEAMNTILSDAVESQEQSAGAVLRYADGSTMTEQAFVEKYRAEQPNATDAEIAASFQEHQRFNDMGLDIPGSAADRVTRQSVTGDAASGQVSQDIYTGKALSEKAQQTERDLTLAELNKIAGKYGVAVEVRDADGKTLMAKENGYYDPTEKKIILNSGKATNQYLMTRYFVHELTHHGQQSDGDVKTGLTSDIIGAMKKIYGEGKVDNLIKQTRATYENHFRATGKDASVINQKNYIEDEVAADFMMKAIGNRALLDRLAGVNQKPLKALIQRAKAFMSGKKDTDIGVKEAQRLIDRMQKSMAAAQKQGLNNLENRSTIDPKKREVRNSVERNEESTDYRGWQDSGRVGGQGQLRHSPDESVERQGVHRSGDLGVHAGTLIPERTRKIMRGKGISDVGLTETDDRSAFSIALDTAKAANPNGGMVDSQSVEGLTESGARTFMRPDGGAGVAVEADGNIVGVFKHPALRVPRAVQDLLLTALSQGGNHLDCYATYTVNDLVDKYTQLGFEPVAWLAFSREYAPDGWNYEAWGEPDVVMFVHNGDAVDQIIGREEPYRAWTKDDIRALPKFEDYDEAKAHQKAELEKRKAGRRYSIDPDTGYEEGSVQDKVLKVLKSGTPEEAIELLQKWGEEVRSGVTQVKPEEQKLADQMRAYKPVTEEEAKANRAKLDKLIEKYGQIKVGEKATRPVFLPKQTGYARGVSQYARTVAESKHTPEWFKQEIERAAANEESGYTYDIATDTEAMNHVEAIKNKGYDVNKADWDALVRNGNGSGKFGGITKNDIALGEFLYTEAVKAGNLADATKLVAELCEIGTAAGQTVQAMSLLKKMTPSGQLYYLMKAVDRMNQQHSKRIDSGKMGEITIDQKLAEAVLSAQTIEDTQKAMDVLLQDIADQVPVTWAEKWNAWRYLSMLGNPKTHVRNMVSNAVFQPVVFLKDMVGSVGEAMFMHGDQKQNRTKNLGQAVASAIYGISPFSNARIKGGKYVTFADQDYRVMQEVLTGGGKHNPADLIRDKRNIFGKKGIGKAVEWASRTNSNLMEKEDAVALQTHYVRALSQYLAAQKADVDKLNSTAEGRALLSKARAYAVVEAKKATFRDASALAAALNRLEKSGLAGQVIVGGVLPFKKTPINILKRGVEYSPLGIINAVNDAVKSKGNAAKFVDSLSASATGTAIMGLGIYLAAQGLLRGGGGDDERERKFEELWGEQTYSFKLNNGTSYTIDWMAPAALPLFVGAEIWKAFGEGQELTLTDLGDTLMLISEPMFQLSMLDGLNTTLKSAGYSDNPLSAVGSTMLTSYFGQAIPTLFGQITRTFFDDTSRGTFIQSGTKMQTFQRAYQTSVLGKGFGMSQQRVPYLDAWGRAETQPDMLKRAIENFLSPGYASKVEKSPMEEELLRLYKVTGDGGVLPTTVSKYFNVGEERHNLTADEWVTYQTTAGQMAYQLITELVNSEGYAQLTDAEKAKAVNSLFDYANEKGRAAAVKEYTIDTAWIEKAEGLLEKGISLTDFVTINSRDKESDGTTIEDLLGMTWLTDEDRANFISAGYGKKLSDEGTIADPNKSYYEYVLTAEQQKEYLEHFDKQWMKDYTTMVNSSYFKGATLEDQAAMIESTRNQSADITQEWMAEKMSGEGIKSQQVADFDTRALRNCSEQAELTRLYGLTGETKVLPKEMSRDFSDNSLNAEQWLKAQEVKENTANEILSRTIKSDMYKMLTDEQKADLIGKIHTYSTEMGKEAAGVQYESDEVAKVKDLEDKGVTVERYYTAAALCNETSGQDTLDLVGMDWLTDDERAWIVASKYAKSLTGGNTFTDKNKKKHEFIMTEEQTEQYLARYDELYLPAYRAMLSGWKYQYGDAETRADLIDDLKSDVCNTLKKEFSNYLPTVGNYSVPKE